MRILNPLSADLNVMRQTLLFNMLEAVRLNANRQQRRSLTLYEFGNCYFYDESKRTDENRLAAYSEEYRLGDRRDGRGRRLQSWNARPARLRRSSRCAPWPRNCCAASASTSTR